MKNFLDYLVIVLFFMNYLLLGMNNFVIFLGIISIFSVVSIYGRFRNFNERV